MSKISFALVEIACVRSTTTTMAHICGDSKRKKNENKIRNSLPQNSDSFAKIKWFRFVRIVCVFGARAIESPARISIFRFEPHTHTHAFHNSETESKNCLFSLSMQMVFDFKASFSEGARFVC